MKRALLKRLSVDPSRLPHIAIALIVVLLGDLVGVTIVPRPITLKAPGELADVVPELQRFVEKTRGRRFHKQVNIELSDDLGRFTAGLQQNTDTRSQEQKDRDQAIDRAAVFRALGLVDAGYDPLAANRSLSNDVVGVYDPRTHTLRVRPGPMTPRKRMTIVHELTHALDGEHHELRFSERTDRLIPDESGQSFRALAEGSASYVEALYYNSLSAEDKAAVEAARGDGPANVPESLVLIASYPYTAGRAFIEQLIKRDGLDAVDRAFEDPPVTSEQVFNVDLYFADEQPKNLVKPLPRGSTVVDRGVFGELLLRLLAARASGNDVARAVGRGWGGGRYVAWRENADVCVAVTLVMDTPADQDELLKSLNQWAAGKPRSKVAAGAAVGFEKCVPR